MEVVEVPGDGEEELPQFPKFALHFEKHFRIVDVTEIENPVDTIYRVQCRACLPKVTQIWLRERNKSTSNLTRHLEVLL